MNRNVESHFSELPQIDIQRSIFDRSSSHKTSFNVGELIPFYIDEVLPGDTFKVTTSAIVRLQTPLTPIMDNIYMDTYWFFVPNRLVHSHWAEILGENKESAWLPTTQYSVPRILPPAGGWNVGTIADYLGIPPGVYDATQSPPMAYPFRGYAMICNEFFRDQNLTDPLNITLGDTVKIGSNGSNYITDTELGGSPFKVSKYHDYFTSCLPAPQKGPDVTLLNNFVGGMWDLQQSVYAPVVVGSKHLTGATGLQGMKLVDYQDNDHYLRGNNNGGVEWKDSGTTGFNVVAPSNLWTDLTDVNITVNDLRLAFQLQKFYEKNALAGTRLREIIKEHFGVTTSDARIQIPEYLGGHRFPLSIHQVANQSQGTNDFLGDLGAMSNTSDIHEDFVKSFEEHGFVFGVCCVRYDHSYPQGMEKFWHRKTKTDYYFPVMSNIGNLPVYKYEIYWANSSDNTNMNVFGYQEAWSEYRYKQSRVSGEMRPGISNSLASWHLSDYYTQAPTLSDGWIREDKANVDRVLSVSSATADQVFCDFYVKNICTRPMPMFSIPGLIDHH